MNPFQRFYRAVYVGRVKALPTTDLYKALTGTLYQTDDADLERTLFELAYDELTERGEIAGRGSAISRTPADFPDNHRGE